MHLRSQIFLGHQRRPIVDIHIGNISSLPQQELYQLQIGLAPCCQDQSKFNNYCAAILGCLISWRFEFFEWSCQRIEIAEKRTYLGQRQSQNKTSWKELYFVIVFGSFERPFDKFVNSEQDKGRIPLL